MRLRIRLFAIYRERLGKDEIELEFSNNSIGIDELRAALIALDPKLEPLLNITRIAVNQQFATEKSRFSENDELALIPPVAGGRPETLFALRASPIQLSEAELAVASNEAGATVSFTGTVRNHNHEHSVEALEYEAYPEMAETFLRKIGDQISEQWPDAKTAILHRVGRVEVGETSVVIAVSHPHRAEAFEACRFAIESLKIDVPIWKKEFRSDGSVWLGVGS
jgi:molybdopterin synthase catalytic subunit/molybdopterin converting factor small subunit